MSNNEAESLVKSSGLGTFAGVYTPSILTILGVIMYLRFGWVVGNVGLLGTLLIVTLSNSITILTALSVCAIATDRVVKVGGAYHIISRSLGIETGGAVGIPLFFAQAISVALYTLGFAESVVSTFTHLNQLYVALAVTVGVGILALTSASIAIKSQYVIMAAIALSLLSFFFGHPLEETKIEWWVTTDTSFWSVFAVFFPAVTGLMAGVNMSGDLKDPSKSLPTGTLGAVLSGYVIYMVLPIFLAMRANSATLIADPLVMKKMAVWGQSILLGVWGATLSSAVGSILGAPRVLQALARDGVFPPYLSFLGKGSGPNDEPKIGTIVTLGIAIAAVCIGDLNLIAPVLSMFFLTTYLVLNLSAGVESFLQSPSFRPVFRVHWSLSILGAVGCIVVMFLINAVATIFAALIILCIYLWIERKEMKVAWGDVRRGMWMELLRIGIWQINHSPEDPKNWRPHILVLSGSPTRRWSLISLANAITHKRGIISVCSVLTADTFDLERKQSIEDSIRSYLEKRGIQSLVRVVFDSDAFSGAVKLVASYGLGPLVPNTILIGDSEARENRDRYCEMLTNLHNYGRNLIILRENTEYNFGEHRSIDIWWGGMKANGSLMLLLAYLLRGDRSWGQAQVYLKLVVDDEAAAAAAKTNLDSLVKKLRIKVIPKVIIGNRRPFREILHESSANTDLIFIGMADPNEKFIDYQEFVKYYEKLQSLVGNLTTVFVLAAPDFAFEEVLIDSKD